MTLERLDTMLAQLGVPTEAEPSASGAELLSVAANRLPGIDQELHLLGLPAEAIPRIPGSAILTRAATLVPSGAHLHGSRLRVVGLMAATALLSFGLGHWSQIGAGNGDPTPERISAAPRLPPPADARSSVLAETSASPFPATSPAPPPRPPNAAQTHARSTPARPTSTPQLAAAPPPNEPTGPTGFTASLLGSSSDRAARSLASAASEQEAPAPEPRQPTMWRGRVGGGATVDPTGAHPTIQVSAHRALGDGPVHIGIGGALAHSPDPTRAVLPSLRVEADFELGSGVVRPEIGWGISAHTQPTERATLPGDATPIGLAISTGPTVGVTVGKTDQKRAFAMVRPQLTRGLSPAAAAIPSVGMELGLQFGTRRRG